MCQIAYGKCVLVLTVNSKINVDYIYKAKNMFVFCFLTDRVLIPPLTQNFLLTRRENNFKPNRQL